MERQTGYLCLLQNWEQGCITCGQAEIFPSLAIQENPVRLGVGAGTGWVCRVLCWGWKPLLIPVGCMEYGGRLKGKMTLVQDKEVLWLCNSPA